MIYIFGEKVMVPNLCILWSRSSSWIVQEFPSFSFPAVEYGWFVFNESFSLDWSRLALIWLRLIMDETAMKRWPRLWIIISAYILIKQCPTQAVRTVVATEYLLLSTSVQTLGQEVSTDVCQNSISGKNIFFYDGLHQILFIDRTIGYNRDALGRALHLQ